MTERMCQTPQCPRPARAKRYRCAICTNEKQRTGYYPGSEPCPTPCKPKKIPPPTPCTPWQHQPDYLFRDELIKALEAVDHLERVHLT